MLLGLAGGLLAVGVYFSSLDVQTQRISIGFGVVSLLFLCWGWRLCTRAERGGRKQRATWTRFRNLQPGATLEECVAALGSHGLRLASSTETVDGKFVESETCVWTNADWSVATLEFQNGRLTSKSQVGLS